MATEAEALEFWKIKPAAAPKNVITMKDEKLTASKPKSRNRKNA